MGHPSFARSFLPQLAAVKLAAQDGFRDEKTSISET
jgi:hypothetical protein